MACGPHPVQRQQPVWLEPPSSSTLKRRREVVLSPPATAFMSFALLEQHRAHPQPWRAVCSSPPIHPRPSQSSSAWRKGFAITSLPSTGLTTTRRVPRTTTSPSGRVISLPSSSGENKLVSNRLHVLSSVLNWIGWVGYTSQQLLHLVQHQVHQRVVPLQHAGRLAPAVELDRDALVEVLFEVQDVFLLGPLLAVAVAAAGWAAGCCCCAAPASSAAAAASAGTASAAAAVGGSVGHASSPLSGSLGGESGWGWRVRLLRGELLRCGGAE